MNYYYYDKRIIQSAYEGTRNIYIFFFKVSNIINYFYESITYFNVRKENTLQMFENIVHRKT
jgi:hypothetical protein